MTEATGVKGIASLNSAGFVKRTNDAHDKRKMIITLTPQARELEAKLIPMVVEVNEQALKGITKKDADMCEKCWNKSTLTSPRKTNNRATNHADQLG